MAIHFTRSKNFTRDGLWVNSGEFGLKCAVLKNSRISSFELGRLSG